MQVSLAFDRDRHCRKFSKLLPSNKGFDPLPEKTSPTPECAIWVAVRSPRDLERYTAATVNCQLSTVNCQLSTVNCQLPNHAISAQS